MSHIRSGNWCMYEILTQDGPLPGKVCEVTTDLIFLVDKCYETELLKRLANTPPTDRRANALAIGNHFHKALFDTAREARLNGRLEARLKITPPVAYRVDPAFTRRGEKSRKGPDFVLTGIFGNENIHAAWDLHPMASMSHHYDRDVLGERSSNPEPALFDPEIHSVTDNVNYWSSYISIFY